MFRIAPLSVTPLVLAVFGLLAPQNPRATIRVEVRMAGVPVAAADVVVAGRTYPSAATTTITQGLDGSTKYARFGPTTRRRFSHNRIDWYVDANGFISFVRVTTRVHPAVWHRGRQDFFQHRIKIVHDPNISPMPPQHSR